MDHSMRGYLERQSKEELDAILKKTLSEKDPWYRENIINVILEIRSNKAKNT